MTIEEIKDEKRNLETTIQKLLNDFQEKNKVRIETEFVRYASGSIYGHFNIFVNF